MNNMIKLIADVCSNSSSSHKIDFSILPENIFQFLSKNQILLPFLKNTQNFNHDSLKSLKNEIIKKLDQEFLIDPDHKTQQVLSLMDELKVKCMLHKPLYFEREQGDVDILIPLEKFDFVINELQSRGFSKTSYESFKIGMSKYENDSKFTIHVHAKIKWESEFISTNDVWHRSREMQMFGYSVYLPSPEDCLLIDCAHATFEARLIRLCDVLQFVKIIKTEKINWDLVIKRMIQYHIEAAGYVYFIGMDTILKEIYNSSVIPSEVIKNFEAQINGEKFAIKWAKNKIISDVIVELPLRISLFSSVLFFLSFNKRLGINNFIWANSVIVSAILRHVAVKLGLRKL